MSNFQTQENIDEFRKGFDDAVSFLDHDQALNFLMRKKYTPYCINILDIEFPSPASEVARSEFISDLESLVYNERGSEALSELVKDQNSKSDNEIARELYEHLRNPGGTAHAYGWIKEYQDPKTQKIMVSMSDDGQDVRNVYRTLRNRSKRLSSENTKSAIGKLRKFAIEAETDRTVVIKNLRAERERLKAELKEVDSKLAALRKGESVKGKSAEYLTDLLQSAMNELDGVPEQIASLAREEDENLAELRHLAAGTLDDQDDAVARYANGYQLRVYEGPNSLGFKTAKELLYLSLDKDGTVTQIENLLDSKKVSEEIKPLIIKTLGKVNECREAIGLMVKINVTGTSILTRLMTMQNTGLWREESERIANATKTLKTLLEQGKHPSVYLPYEGIKGTLYPYRQIETKKGKPVPQALTKDVPMDPEQEKELRRLERFQRSGSSKRLLSICKNSVVFAPNGRVDLAASFNAANTGEEHLLQDICNAVSEYYDEDDITPTARWIFQTASGQKMCLILPNIYLDKEILEKETGTSIEPPEAKKIFQGEVA